MSPLPKLPQPVPLKKGVAILPSLFTLANMMAGYYGIIAAVQGEIQLAVTMIVFAGMLDSLDGRIARMTNTVSEFGKELDSLSDFLSFGVAPALILYHWGLGEVGRWGWMLAFLLPVAAALRLARFNVQQKGSDKRFFLGLPAPMAAAAAVLPLYYLPQDQADLTLWWKRATVLWVVTISLLMVSRIRYRSFKELNVGSRRPPAIFFLLAAILVLVLVNPSLSLLCLAVAFAASGPVGWLWERMTGKKPPVPENNAPGEDDDEE